MKPQLTCAALLAFSFLASPVLADDTKPGWAWHKVQNRYPNKPLRAKVLHTRYTLQELPPAKGKQQTTAVLEKELSKGGTNLSIWRSKIGDEVWGKVAGAAMLVSGEHIYIARHSRIATGCKLYAFATKDGSLLWSASLTGIGPVSHSKWRNDVQLDLFEGNPVVFGREGQRYIEVRDAKTGALISNQQLGWRPGKNSRK